MEEEFELEFELDTEEAEIDTEEDIANIDCTVDFDAFTEKYVESILPGQNIDVSKEGKIYTVSSTISRLSELNDDIGFGNLQSQVNNLQNSEDNEMIDIVSLIERRTENFIEME